MKSLIETPYFLVDEKKLIHNLEILKALQDDTGCKVLLAQKAFSMFYAYPLISKYLAGTCGSGLYETRLGIVRKCSSFKINEKLSSSFE